MISRNPTALLFAYGMSLCIFGVLVAGFGHGTYTLLALAGAPFSAFGIPFAIVATLLQWGALSFLRGRYEIAPRYFVAFLMLHYIVAALLLSLRSSEFADWKYLRDLPQFDWLLLTGGFGVYVLGQVSIWKSLTPPAPSPPQP